MTKVDAESSVTDRLPKALGGSAALVVRRAASRPVATLALIGLVHRVVAMGRFHHAVSTMVAQNPGYLTMQLLPVDDVRRHFWRSLLFLQQSPPLDLLVMKAALLAPGPYGVAVLLCGLNGLLTVATSCVLCRIVAQASGSRIFGFCLACWFVLSTDMLVMEYALFGQMFYEFLAMLGGAVTCAALTTMTGTAWRRAALAGTTTALAALSRASFSYLAVPLALYGTWRWRWPGVAAFMLPVLLLQVGWVAKNAVVYGGFSLETSSWGGLNAERGLTWAGQQNRFCEEIVAGRLGTYPDWFVHMNRDCPLPFSDTSERYVPDEIRQRDAAIAASLGGSTPVWNTVALQRKAFWYRRAVLRFTVEHPRLAWDRFVIGYRIFWQRMADYGALLFDPLFVMPVDRPLLSVLSRGFGEKQRLMRTFSASREAASAPAAFATISLAPLDAVSLATLHVLFPLLLGLDLWRRLQGGRAVLPRGTAVMAIITAYGLVMFCAFDVGENMRFRLAVEPEILALTSVCLATAWRRATAILIRTGSGVDR